MNNRLIKRWSRPRAGVLFSYRRESSPRNGKAPEHIQSLVAAIKPAVEATKNSDLAPPSQRTLNTARYHRIAELGL